MRTPPTAHPVYIDVSDNGLADLAPLLQAADAEALRRALVIPARVRPHFEPSMALSLFRQHHSGDRVGGLDTALLLCTDPRWSKAARPLVEGIVETGLLGAADVDALSLAFLAGPDLAFECPGLWLTTHFRVHRDGQWKRPNGAKTHVVLRPIATPLRRWAAAHGARRTGEPFDAVLGGIDDIPGRDAAAVMAGMVDAIGDLAEPLATRVLETALAWPSSATRLPALITLSARGDDVRARALAAADADAKVRRWGQRPVQRPLTAEAAVGAGVSTSPPGPESASRPGAESADQITLFN